MPRVSTSTAAIALNVNATHRATTARGQRTRAALIDATAALVAERGFHSVGITEIGAAAGVSGAAIYRHFANKDDLLVAVFERVVGELITGARSAIASTASPSVALRRLIAAHVTFALEHADVIRVYEQEAHNLPVVERKRVRRQQRSYAQLWREAVERVRPAWTAPEATAAVHAVFGLINSVSNYRSGLAKADQHRFLTGLATQALNPR